MPGWLTRAQGRALWDAAATCPADGSIAEIGSHQGRSTVVLARRAADAGARVIAIDPFVDGAMFGGAGHPRPLRAQHPRRRRRARRCG